MVVLSFPIPDDVAARLTAEAHAAGLDLATYAQQRLLAAGSADSAMIPPPPAPLKVWTRPPTDEEIAERRKTQPKELPPPHDYGQLLVPPDLTTTEMLIIAEGEDFK